jgi:hypothetical protein
MMMAGGHCAACAGDTRFMATRQTIGTRHAESRTISDFTT